MNNEIIKYKIMPIINCDGYYPQCPRCYYFDLEQGKDCPQCGQEIDWDFLDKDNNNDNNIDK